MRKAQRRLGDSVEWIVDTLLQDEGDANNSSNIGLGNHSVPVQLLNVVGASREHVTEVVQVGSGVLPGGGRLV